MGHRLNDRAFLKFRSLFAKLAFIEDSNTLPRVYPHIGPYYRTVMGSSAACSLRAHKNSFHVRKGNERVWQFHERFGAVRTAETELEYLYRIEAPAITASRIRYRRFLEGSVTVAASD